MILWLDSVKFHLSFLKWLQAKLMFFLVTLQPHPELAEFSSIGYLREKGTKITFDATENHMASGFTLHLFFFLISCAIWTLQKYITLV